jgi:hypothetical protein
MEIFYPYNAHQGGLHKINRLCTTPFFKKCLKQLEKQEDYCGNFAPTEMKPDVNTLVYDCAEQIMQVTDTIKPQRS